MVCGWAGAWFLPLSLHAQSPWLISRSDNLDLAAGLRPRTGINPAASIQLLPLSLALVCGSSGFLNELPKVLYYSIPLAPTWKCLYPGALGCVPQATRGECLKRNVFEFQIFFPCLLTHHPWTDLRPTPGMPRLEPKPRKQVLEAVGDFQSVAFS